MRYRYGWVGMRITLVRYDSVDGCAYKLLLLRCMAMRAGNLRI